VKLICKTGDNGSYEMDYAVLDLTPAIARLLLDYRKLIPSGPATQTTFHSIVLFNYEVEYGMLHHDTELDGIDNLGWYYNVASLVITSVSPSTVCVTKTGVYWAASSKYADRPVEIETPEISWDALQAVVDGYNPFEYTGSNAVAVRVRLTEAELATVLAGLRCLQQECDHTSDMKTRFSDIFTDVSPVADIDALCEKLNIDSGDSVKEPPDA
jgi:hypothetical protein